MLFEWEKEKSNILKHKIDFARASLVFTDPNLLLVPDPCKTEERWNAIGCVDNILFVVYTEREKETIRIISARKATKEEINGYKNYDFGRD